MGLRGSSWFRCDECRKLSLFTVREQNRAGRIRCTGCGSARLTVSAEGAAKQARPVRWSSPCKSGTRA